MRARAPAAEGLVVGTSADGGIDKEGGIVPHADPGDYSRRATEHAPATAEGLRDAALEMLRSGLTDHDAAHVLRLDVNALRRLIGACPGCSE